MPLQTQQLYNATCLTGLPRWFNCKDSSRWCRRHRRHGFNPWVGKIPWRRERQPPPVLLPEKYHGQRSLAGYSPWGHWFGHKWACTHVFDWLFLKCPFKDFIGGDSFTVRSRGRYRDIPHPLCRHIHSLPGINIPQQKSELFFFSSFTFSLAGPQVAASSQLTLCIIPSLLPFVCFSCGSPTLCFVCLWSHRILY